MYKRFLITLIATAYGALCGGIPAANALNTDLVVGLCSGCVKTADYEEAAWSLISSQAVIKWPGNYNPITYTAIMSNTAASTAYVKISGAWGISARKIVFIASTFTPVDASGNSLASESEAYLENYYTQVDWSVFGIFRSDPTVADFSSGSAAQDFVGTPDTAVSANIVNNAHLGDGIAAGTPITVTFADGIVATFVRTTDTTASDYSHWWVWGNVAHNPKNVCIVAPGTMLTICGAPIDRKGNVIVNYNTSGTSGGSANPSTPYYLYSVPIPPGSFNYCTFSSYFTDPAGQTFGSTGYGPC